MLSLLIISAHIGRYLNYYRNKSRAGGDVIVTAGMLSLCVPHIGFAFSVSIKGYITLNQAQVREAKTIEEAWQYSLLLPASAQPKAQELLRKYLDQRIHFFRHNSLQWGRSWNQLLEGSKLQLWLLPVRELLLTACNELRSSQQQTTAGYQQKSLMRRGWRSLSSPWPPAV